MTKVQPLPSSLYSRYWSADCQIPSVPLWKAQRCPATRHASTATVPFKTSLQQLLQHAVSSSGCCFSNANSIHLCMAFVRPKIKKAEVGCLQYYRAYMVYRGLERWLDSRLEGEEESGSPLSFLEACKCFPSRYFLKHLDSRRMKGTSVTSRWDQLFKAFCVFPILFGFFPKVIETGMWISLE